MDPRPTTDATPLHVVLGASGGIGSAVVRALAADGHRVRAVTRRGDADVPAGVERLAADVSTPDGARAAAAGAAVVYHCAQPAYTRWPQEFPPLTEAVAAGAAEAGARLVFADNLYMYGPIAGTITEATPQGATTKKGKVRLEMAERLLAAHRAGTLRVAIGRASDYYGPGGVATAAGERLFGAALGGKTVAWPASLDQPHTFHYLEDLARGLVTLGTRPEADGRAWILPAAEPLTAREFVGLVFAEVGGPPKMRPLPKLALRAAGLFVPEARELPELWYQSAAPFVADAAAFQSAFGPAPVTPHPEAVRRTVAWFRARAADRA